MSVKCIKPYCAQKVLKYFFAGFFSIVNYFLFAQPTTSKVQTSSTAAKNIRNVSVKVTISLRNLRCVLYEGSPWQNLLHMAQVCGFETVIFLNEAILCKQHPPSTPVCKDR